MSLEDEKSHDDKFEWRNKRFHLTFKSHIHKSNLLSFIDGIAPSRFHFIVHETGTKNEKPYLHTHCLLWLFKQPNFRGSRKYDWPDHDYSVIHPHATKVANDDHWNYLVAKYFAKDDEDPLTNIPEEGVPEAASVVIQMDNIQRKRTLGDVYRDEDTAHIMQKRQRWATDVFFHERFEYRPTFKRQKSLQADGTMDYTPPEIRCFWGESETGKTSACWDAAPDADPVTYVGNFILSYSGSPDIILDELDGSSFPYKFFIKLTDRFPLRVNIKGHERWWSPTRILITSQSHPKDWYFGLKPEELHALLRRFTEIKEFSREK